MALLARRPREPNLALAAASFLPQKGRIARVLLSLAEALELGENTYHLRHRLADGVDASRPCWCRYRSTPLACSSCNTSSKSVSDRPSLSTDEAATRSNSRRATPFRSADKPGRSFFPFAPLGFCGPQKLAPPTILGALPRLALVADCRSSGRSWKPGDKSQRAWLAPPLNRLRVYRYLYIK